MGEKTDIQWCHATFNIVWGCHKVSEECKFCYAEAWSKRTGYNGQSQRAGGQGPIRAPLPVIWGPGPDTPRRTFGDKHWREPLAWDREAAAAGERRRVFCSSMADVFEEHPTLETEREKLWPLIMATPHLDWLLLTKRPQNILRMVPSWNRWPSNIWIGTTVGVRSSLSRLDWLRQVPVDVRFVSCEPLLEDLGEVDFTGIGWVIIGGESGPKARPFDIRWGQSVERDARAAGAAVFWKQLGAKPCVTLRGEREQYPGPPDGSVVLGEEMPPERRELRFLDSHGGDWREWPERLRTREFPDPAKIHALETGAFI